MISSISMTLVRITGRTIFNPDTRKYWDHSYIASHSIYANIRDRQGRIKNKSGKNFLGQHFYNIHPDGITGPTIIFYHGSSGNYELYNTIYYISELLGFNLFMGEYEGYGKNYHTGVDYWSGVTKQSLEIYDHVTSIVPKENIILWGLSLGGTAVTYVSHLRPHNHPTIISFSFSSIADILKSRNPILLGYERGFTGWIPSYKWARSITAPYLQIHSPNDKYVTYDSAKILYSNVPSRDKTWLNIDGGHTTPIVSPQVAEKLILFLWRFFPNQSDRENLENLALQASNIFTNNTSSFQNK